MLHVSSCHCTCSTAQQNPPLGCLPGSRRRRQHAPSSLSSDTCGLLRLTHTHTHTQTHTTRVCVSHPSGPACARGSDTRCRGMITVSVQCSKQGISITTCTATCQCQDTQQVACLLPPLRRKSSQPCSAAGQLKPGAWHRLDTALQSRLQHSTRHKGWHNK